MELTRSGLPVASGAASRLAVLWLATLAGAAPVAAQATPWRIASMRMEAALDPSDGSAAVSMRWTLVAAQPGAPLPLDAPVPVEILGFGEAEVTEVEHEGAGRVVLWPTQGTHRAATLRPPFAGAPEVGAAEVGAAEAGAAEAGAAEAGAAEAGTPEAGTGTALPSLELAFSYRATSVLEEDDGSVRVRIPVLTGPPVAGGEPGAVDVATLQAAGLGPVGFSASLAVPEGWRISDGFPTGLRRAGDGALRAELQVAPAMLGLQARPDGAWRPGLPLVLDVLALSVMLAFALRGWLHLRGIVTARRASNGTPDAASIR